MTIVVSPRRSSRSKISHASQPAKFGNHEISQADGEVASPALAPADLDTAIETCFQQGGLFAKEAKVSVLLCHCYVLGLQLAEGGDEACKSALNHMYFEGKRDTPLGKPYLIAVRLGAKPVHNAEYKMCSDYAAALVHADDEGISPADFAKWFSENPLSHCLKAVRAKRRVASGKEYPAKESSPTHIDTQYERPNKPNIETPIPSFVLDAIQSVFGEVTPSSPSEYIDALSLAVEKLKAELGHAEADHAY